MYVGRNSSVPTGYINVPDISILMEYRVSSRHDWVNGHFVVLIFNETSPLTHGG